MLTAAFILMQLVSAPAAKADSKPAPPPAQSTKLDETVASGRCIVIGESPDERVSAAESLPPGKPPLLSFRFYEAKAHHGADSSGLMLDDAGH
jgi:hypothetical protein